MTGHLTTTGIRQVIGQRGSILAAVATVALIGSALVVLVLSYREAVARARLRRARPRTGHARPARGEVLLARPGGDERVPAHAEPWDSARDRGARPLFGKTTSELRTKSVDQASRAQLRRAVSARHASEETFERFSAAAERGTEEENRAILALQALEPGSSGRSMRLAGSTIRPSTHDRRLRRKKAEGRWSPVSSRHWWR